MKIQPSETLEMMVVVKAYPVLSDAHGESVCVAGVVLNRGEPQWGRLFPVPFRRLPKDRKFKKYDIIRLNAWRTSDDERPESWLPNAESIEVLESIPANRDWRKRTDLVRPLLADSMCSIQRQQAEMGASLGIFRPGKVTNFKFEPSKTRSSGQTGIANQIDLFEPSMAALEELPYKFKYAFECANEASCRGHNMSILDWEIGQAFRKWRDSLGSEDRVLDAIRKKWFDEMTGPTKDLHFFCGNIARYPSSFCILGTFWPPHTPDTLF